MYLGGINRVWIPLEWLKRLKLTKRIRDVWETKNLIQLKVVGLTF